MKRFIRLAAGAAALAAVGLIGYLIGRSAPGSEAVSARRLEGDISAPAKTPEHWTCSMHPQVRLERPGVCPICEMPLIPAASAGREQSGEVPTMQLSEHALAMAGIETAPVERRVLSKDVRTVGRVEFNESSLATITARIDGYAERLFVNFTGIDIRAGDHVVEIYSPELLVAQQELLIALAGGADRSLMNAAKVKLRLYGLTDAQIAELENTRTPMERITLYSPIDGTVIEKKIVQHEAFRAGDALYRIANLDTVWVYLDVYKYDLPWLRYGQYVRLTAEAYPGRTFRGMVTFIQPVVNEMTRAIRVPVHVENPDHALKPGMYVSAAVDSVLGHDGSAAPTGVEGRFTCPMHPQVLRETDAEDGCPVCGMPLEQIPPAASTAMAEGGSAVGGDSTGYLCPMRCEEEKTYPEPGRCPVCNMALERSEELVIEGLLAVPVSAVLDSGTRTIVYVERSRGLFEPREVIASPRASDYVPVLRGLSDGERIAVRGGFLIDSQFQITGHPSLFYPGGLHADMSHAHRPPEPIPEPIPELNPEPVRPSEGDQRSPPPPENHQH